MRSMVKIKTKKLLLIRHAKSSWSNPSLSDYDRPLNKRGKKDASFMGKQLLQRNLVPDLFLSSSAKRAKKTAKRIAKELKFSTEAIRYGSNIYTADETGLLEMVRTVDEKVGTLFLVGHNFTITGLARELVGEEIVHVPTTGIVGIGFTGKWQSLGSGDEKLLFFDFPKKFKK